MFEARARICVCMHDSDEICTRIYMYVHRSSYSLLFLAGVTAAEAWTGVAAPLTQLGLRGAHRSCGMQAPAMVLGASSSEILRLDRRALLEFAGKSAVAPVVVGIAFPREAAAESLSKDTAAAVGKLPLDVLKVSLLCPPFFPLGVFLTHVRTHADDRRRQREGVQGPPSRLRERPYRHRARALPGLYVWCRKSAGDRRPSYQPASAVSVQDERRPDQIRPGQWYCA